MKLRIFIMVFILFSGFNIQAQLTKEWQRVFGGSDDDVLTSVQYTLPDKGFIIAGYSKSNISGNKKENAYNNSYDFWLVKTNADGYIKWSKTIGSTASDIQPVVAQTREGGYLIAGVSNSPIGGDKHADAYNKSYDYWVIKMDALGNIQWEKNIGGFSLDVPTIAFQAKEGGYLIGGYSHSDSTGDKNQKNRGTPLWCDFWLVKMDTRGNIKWRQTYGGTNEDVLTTAYPTADSGYILGGYSYSPRGYYEKTEEFLGNCDYWLVKIDQNGNKQWDKTIGGSLSDYLTSIQQTNDGGYILGGYSNSPASFHKTGAFLGTTDYWLVKTDASGNVLWDKTYGGTGGDYLSSLQQTNDGSYILGGYSNSPASETKTEDSKGNDDYWIIKTDSMGNPLWNKTIGGSAKDQLASVTEFAPGKYILAGTSNSPVSGDKTEQEGGNDYWLIQANDSTYTLPVTLLDIQADKQENNVVVSWTVASEINMQEYIVKRSTNGVLFETIAHVPSLESTSKFTYSYIDSNAASIAAPILYYYIIAMEKSGASLPSSVTFVKLENNNISAQFFPNPVKNELKILYSSAKETKINIRITDLQGRTLFVQPYSITVGDNLLSVNFLNYPAGLYFVTIYREGDVPLQQKIIHNP